MGWNTEWKALSARIKALLEAGEFFFGTFGAWSNDYTGASSDLTAGADDVVKRLEEFHSSYASALPPIGECRLRQFADTYLTRFTRLSSTGGIPGVQARLTRLAAFRSEMDYLLADTDVVARNAVERAFLHLQRSIIADPSVQSLWRGAFDEGEVRCEKLGAVHLLLHGIWAFKVSAKGERTDLVLGEKLQITPQIEQASEALVLTEWKSVRAEGEFEQKAEEAFEQAKAYAVGVMAGFELASRRYLVMVSLKRLEMPTARSFGNVIYEYRNIAVTPDSPSKAAKRARAANAH